MKHTIATLSFVFAVGTSSLFAWSIPGLSKTTDSAEEAAKTTTDTAQSAADLSKSLTESINEAKSSMSDNPEMTSLLNNISKEASSGEDVSLVESLKGLYDVPDGVALTSEQKELLSEVQGQAEALALTRSFSDDPEMSGPVTQAVKAVQTRDTTAAVSSLKAIADKGTLSDSQQTLVKSMLGNYSNYIDSASQVSSALKGLF